MLHLPAPIFGHQSDQIQECERLLDEYIDRTKGEKRKDLLRLRDTILKRWNAYFFAKGNPATLGPTIFARSSPDDNQKTDGDLLFSCYSSGTRADRDIVGVASGARIGICPYCGLRFRKKAKNRSYDRDHVVPRSVFPEFSILVVNLVSACDECNSAKSSKVLDEQGEWLFLHPYFDDFLARRLIAADVAADFSGVRPVLHFRSSPVGLASAQANRLHRHLKELDVLERMQEEAGHELQLLLDQQKLHAADAREVARGFAAQAEDRLRRRPNDPLGIALAATAASQLLGEFLQ